MPKDRLSSKGKSLHINDNSSDDDNIRYGSHVGALQSSQSSLTTSPPTPHGRSTSNTPAIVSSIVTVIAGVAQV
jgi:hypothetical protein